MQTIYDILRTRKGHSNKIQGMLYCLRCDNSIFTSPEKKDNKVVLKDYSFL